MADDTDWGFPEPPKEPSFVIDSDPVFCQASDKGPSPLPPPPPREPTGIELAEWCLHGLKPARPNVAQLDRELVAAAQLYVLCDRHHIGEEHWWFHNPTTFSVIQIITLYLKQTKLDMAGHRVWRWMCDQCVMEDHFYTCLRHNLLPMLKSETVFGSSRISIISI